MVIAICDDDTLFTEQLSSYLKQFFKRNNLTCPDFLIFDEDYTKKNRAHCCYLMALGNIGLQNREKATEFLNEALEIEPSHMMATLYQKQ